MTETGLPWVEIFAALGEQPHNSRKLVEACGKFLSHFPMDDPSDLHTELVSKGLGLVRPMDLRDNGRGDYFISVWNLGLKTGGTPMVHAPLNLAYSMGGRLSEMGKTLYTKVVNFASLDVYSGQILRLSGEPKVTEIPLSSRAIIH